MSGQDLVGIASGFVDAFGAADWDRAAVPLAPDSVYNEIGTQRTLNGRDEILQAFQGWKKAMPDVKGTITNSFSAGNTVTLEITWNGTQTGPMETPDGTIPPSGKSQTTPSAWVLEFEGEKIKESRHYFDMVTLLTQIGAMPQ